MDVFNDLGAIGNASSFGSFAVGDMAPLLINLTETARHLTHGPGDYLGTSLQKVDEACKRIRDYAEYLDDRRLEYIIEVFNQKKRAAEQESLRYSKKTRTHKFLHYVQNRSKHSALHDDIVAFLDLVVTDTQSACMNGLKAERNRRRGENLNTSGSPPGTSPLAPPTYPPTPSALPTHPPTSPSAPPTYPPTPPSSSASPTNRPASPSTSSTHPPKTTLPVPEPAKVRTQNPFE